MSVLALLSPATLASTLQSFLDAPSTWQHLVRFDPQGRVHVRIAATDRWEAWLLTWLPGQRTGLHDHGGSGGVFAVVQGTLVESTPVAPPLHLSGGRKRGFGPHHLHDVGNESAEPAVSVHVYGPALTAMTRYRLVDGAPVAVGRDEVGVDW